MATQAAAGRGTTPPYVSYPSFRTLLSDLHEHGTPSRIDRSVLKRFSGIVGTQLLTALRFLQLINDQSEPTSQLHELADTFGDPQWTMMLGALLRDAYAPLFGLDLENATASHFNETFRKSFPGSEAVAQKSATFFLGAAKDAGIVISERVLYGRKPRATNGAPRRQKMAATPKGEKKKAAIDIPPPSDDSLSKLGLDSLLLEMLKRIPSKEAGWPKEQRVRWFKTFAANVSEVFDDPKSPVDLAIDLPGAGAKKAPAP
jgi:hypothetical protein